MRNYLLIMIICAFACAVHAEEVEAYDCALTWDKHTTPAVDRYNVYRDNVLVQQVSVNEFLIKNCEPFGVYSVSAVTVKNAESAKSAPITFDLAYLNTIRPPKPPVNLGIGFRRK